MSQAATFSRFASIIGIPSSSSKGGNATGDSANDDSDWYLPYTGPYERPKTLVQYTPVHPYAGGETTVETGNDFYEDDDEPLRGRRRSRPISRTNDTFQPSLVYPATTGPVPPLPKTGGRQPTYLSLDVGGIGDSPRPLTSAASPVSAKFPHSSSSKVLSSHIPPNTNSMDKRGSLANLMRTKSSHVTPILSSFSFPSKRDSAARNLPFGPESSKNGGGVAQYDATGRPRSKSHVTSPTTRGVVAPPTHAYGETKVMTKQSPLPVGPLPHPYSTSYAAAQSAFLPLPSTSNTLQPRQQSIPSPISSASPGTPTPSSSHFHTSHYTPQTPSTSMAHHPFASAASPNQHPFPSSSTQPFQQPTSFSPNLRARLKSLKASVSTPNLRTSLLSSQPSTPRQQPSTPREKSKERSIFITGLCDAFFLPRPKVRAHPISPPDTPPLETPVTLHSIPPPPSPGLQRVLKEGRELARERAEWSQTAVNSFQNTRSRSLSRSRKGRKPARVGGTLSNKPSRDFQQESTDTSGVTSSFDFLAASAFSQGSSAVKRKHSVSTTSKTPRPGTSDTMASRTGTGGMSTGRSRALTHSPSNSTNRSTPTPSHSHSQTQSVVYSHKKGDSAGSAGGLGLAAGLIAAVQDVGKGKGPAYVPGHVRNASREAYILGGTGASVSRSGTITARAGGAAAANPSAGPPRSSQFAHIAGQSSTSTTVSAQLSAFGYVPGHQRNPSWPKTVLKRAAQGVCGSDEPFASPVPSPHHDLLSSSSQQQQHIISPEVLDLNLNRTTLIHRASVIRRVRSTGDDLRTSTGRRSQEMREDGEDGDREDEVWEEGDRWGSADVGKWGVDGGVRWTHFGGDGVEGGESEGAEGGDGSVVDLSKVLKARAKQDLVVAATSGAPPPSLLAIPGHIRDGSGSSVGYGYGGGGGSSRASLMTGFNPTPGEAPGDVGLAFGTPPGGVTPQMQMRGSGSGTPLINVDYFSGGTPVVVAGPNRHRLPPHVMVSSHQHSGSGQQYPSHQQTGSISHQHHQHTGSTSQYPPPDPAAVELSRKISSRRAAAPPTYSASAEDILSMYANQPPTSVYPHTPTRPTLSRSGTASALGSSDGVLPPSSTMHEAYQHYPYNPSSGLEDHPYGAGFTGFSWPDEKALIAQQHDLVPPPPLLIRPPEQRMFAPSAGSGRVREVTSVELTMTPPPLSQPSSYGFHPSPQLPGSPIPLEDENHPPSSPRRGDIPAPFRMDNQPSQPSPLRMGYHLPTSSSDLTRAFGRSGSPDSMMGSNDTNHDNLTFEAGATLTRLLSNRSVTSPRNMSGAGAKAAVSPIAPSAWKETVSIGRKGSVTAPTPIIRNTPTRTTTLPSSNTFSGSAAAAPASFGTTSASFGPGMSFSASPGTFGSGGGGVLSATRPFAATLSQVPSVGTFGAPSSTPFEIGSSALAATSTPPTSSADIDPFDARPVARIRYHHPYSSAAADARVAASPRSGDEQDEQCEETYQVSQAAHAAFQTPGSRSFRSEDLLDPASAMPGPSKASSRLASGSTLGSHDSRSPTNIVVIGRTPSSGTGRSNGMSSQDSSPKTSPKPTGSIIDDLDRFEGLFYRPGGKTSGSSSTRSRGTPGSDAKRSVLSLDEYVQKAKMGDRGEEEEEDDTAELEAQIAQALYSPEPSANPSADASPVAHSFLGAPMRGMGGQERPRSPRLPAEELEKKWSTRPAVRRASSSESHSLYSSRAGSLLTGSVRISGERGSEGSRRVDSFSSSGPRSAAIPGRVSQYLDIPEDVESSQGSIYDEGFRLGRVAGLSIVPNLVANESRRVSSTISVVGEGDEEQEAHAFELPPVPTLLPLTPRRANNKGVAFPRARESTWSYHDSSPASPPLQPSLPTPPRHRKISSGDHTRHDSLTASSSQPHTPHSPPFLAPSVPLSSRRPPRVIPASIEELVRASFMTTTSAASGMSGLSDFPTPPSPPMPSTTQSYFAQRQKHHFKGLEPEQQSEDDDVYEGGESDSRGRLEQHTQERERDDWSPSRARTLSFPSNSHRSTFGFDPIAEDVDHTPWPYRRGSPRA